jgi:hypothetical protein
MNLSHWQYLLAIEDDVIQLSRYVEFNIDNYSTYSIEIARILMTATQEIDVLLKQVCSKYGDGSNSEQGYRLFFSSQFPKISDIEVTTFIGELTLKPFDSWKINQTPAWWTANNKVKHHRHIHYQKASLESGLNAVAGLLIANLYFYLPLPSNEQLYPATKLLYPNDCIVSMSPTVLGLLPNYQLPS